MEYRGQTLALFLRTQLGLQRFWGPSAEVSQTGKMVTGTNFRSDPYRRFKAGLFAEIRASHHFSEPTDF
jgi:hypothetical protein